MNNMFCHTLVSVYLYVSADFMRKHAKEQATGASEFMNFMHRK
jgi:ferritin